CYDADFYPFGGERPITNSCPQNYKFAGKERDLETSLDDFGARYYSSALGRFLSADPLLNSGHPSDPQTWNRYSYALSNPLRYEDPTGLYVWGKCKASKQECEEYKKHFEQGLKALKDAISKLDPGSPERKKLEQIAAKYGD